jgi:hypothetical protein
MGKEKPLKQGSPETSSHPSDAADWLNAFKKHFSIAFQDATSGMADQPANEELQRAAIVAMTTTLRDSGLSDDQMLIFLSDAFEAARVAAIEWTPELNQRRIELIDLDIANTISFDEKVELAKLTDALRESVNTDEAAPIAGARELHAKLKEMEQKEDQP